MRDTTEQLTVIEQVGVWSYTTRVVRYVIVFLAALPLLPIMGHFAHNRNLMWIVGLIVLVTIPVTLDRRSRTELTTVESRRVLQSQLTGWSTGDPRLDGWVVHQATPAAEHRAKHPFEDWPSVGLFAAALLTLAAIAGVLVSPWWLLCLVTLPLFLALPIARAQADPASVLEMLTTRALD